MKTSIVIVRRKRGLYLVRRPNQPQIVLAAPSMGAVLRQLNPVLLTILLALCSPPCLW